MTAAERYVTEQLRAMLNPSTPYRMGALLLTYPTDPPAPRECRIAQAIMIAKLEEMPAADITAMIKQLRVAADELDAVVNGKAPLPEQPR